MMIDREPVHSSPVVNKCPLVRTHHAFYSAPVGDFVGMASILHASSTVRDSNWQPPARKPLSLSPRLQRTIASYFHLVDDSPPTLWYGEAGILTYHYWSIGSDLKRLMFVSVNIGSYGCWRCRGNKLQLSVGG